MDSRNGSGPPAKRVKLDSGKAKPLASVKPRQPEQKKFGTVEEIRASLRSQTQEELVAGLTVLRNQLTVKFYETGISPQDERLLLVQHWLGNDPGAHDLFAIWENATPRQTSLLALVVSVLGAVLTLLSSHYTYHVLGQPITKGLLSPPSMRKLNSYLTGSHNELVLVTLKLFNVLSTFAGGRERKTILESFAWETKSLPKLLNMRRKTQTEDFTDPLVRPDIRTLYILFILSFVDTTSTTQIKNAFLEQHKDIFLSIFKGLVQDSYSVVRKILEVCWAGIWADPKIKRTLKIGLFNEATVAQIMKLYDRAAPEDNDGDHIPADLIHHFLLAICTRPGTGICFRDRGWYPRDTDTDNDADRDNDRPSKRGGIHNRMLANILKTLKVNEDIRQQELAIKIMAACPELVAGYWQAVALTLEPRLSSKWIANIAFFGLVLSLPPPPSTSFLLPNNTTIYQPTPPPLWSLTENVLPAVSTKHNLSKGLQSASPLVQHCSALALAKCLIKYLRVLALLREIEAALEEDEADGQWVKRRKELEREVRRRVPEFQVVVGFSQQAGKAVAVVLAQQQQQQQKGTVNPAREAMLGESAQRLLWLYHCCLPGMVAEAKFDVGKLLVNFDGRAVVSVGEGSEEDSEPNAATKLHTVRQLHVLRLLKESDQFTWSGKEASSSKTYLYVLLNAYSTTQVDATRLALGALLRHILGQSILFQDDPDEAELWLSSLPTIRRSVAAEAPDGAKLTDEALSVIPFLDDCIQRCLKTPYKYIEEKVALIGPAADCDPSPSGNESEKPPSALLMTVLEQLGAKIKGKLLQPTDVLAIASFIRKLLLKLSGKQQDLELLCAVAKKLDMLLPADLFASYPTVSQAIREEVSNTHIALAPSRSPMIALPITSTIEVEAFLTQAEGFVETMSETTRAVTALELVDWIRLVGTSHSLRPEDVARALAIVQHLHRPALKNISEALAGMQGLLWAALDMSSLSADCWNQFSFEFLFTQIGDLQLEVVAHREALVNAVFTNKSSAGVVDVRRVICLIGHSLSVSAARASVTRDLLLLTSAILNRASTILNTMQMNELKEYVFVQSARYKPLWTAGSLSPLLRTGIQSVVDTSLNAASPHDRVIVADITAHWLQTLQHGIREHSQLQVDILSAQPWIHHLESNELFCLLDVLGRTQGTPEPAILELITSVLTALQRSTQSEADAESALRKRLTQLLCMLPILAGSVILENMIATAVDVCLPAGHDGTLSLCPADVDQSLTSLISRAEARWSRHLDVSPTTDVDISSFLEQELWSAATVRIITGLLYRQAFSRAAFFEWLGCDNCRQRSITQVACIISALCDSSSPFSEAETEVLASHSKRLVRELMNARRSERSRSACGTAFSHLFVTLLLKRARVGALFSKKLQTASVGMLVAATLSVGVRVNALASGSAAQDIASSLLDHGLQWAVDFLAAGHPQTGESKSMLQQLESLIETTSEVKSHLAETVLTAVIQNRLTDTVALEFVAKLVKASPLKPLLVNRHLQSILQHTQFFKLCAIPALTPSPVRDALINLLYVLFSLHPWNTCQPSHVEPLIRIYRGTLSTPDRQLLTVFHMFEIQRKTSVASLLSRWLSSPELMSSTALEAVQSLDPIRVLKTCLSYPKWRKLEDQVEVKANQGYVPEDDDQLYDPVFLALVFSQMITDCPPDTAFAWVELFRTNIVSLLIRSLSAKDGRMREVALHQIAALWKYMETADMQERPHVTYILNLLKDAMPPAAADDAPAQLPSYITLLLSHALRGVFNPSNFIYPITARFLLQRPEIDITDVPMLYSMLYSSSEDWKKERAWMVRFLSDGMTGAEDWRVFKRRHTWDLLESLFQSSEKDRVLRNGILEVLANLTSNAQATMSLVLKSALLTWIEMQLLVLQPEEAVAWVRILENVLVVVDPGKLEAAVGVEWRSTVCRCISLVLEQSASSITVLPIISAVILRLSLLPGPPIPALAQLVDRALGVLRLVENSRDMTTTSCKFAQAHRAAIATPLHRARGLNELRTRSASVEEWGQCVEALWRVCMTLSMEELDGVVKVDTWGALTSRMLVYRAVAGEQRCWTGEWARKQVLVNMGNI